MRRFIWRKSRKINGMAEGGDSERVVARIRKSQSILGVASCTFDSESQILLPSLCWFDLGLTFWNLNQELVRAICRRVKQLINQPCLTQRCYPTMDVVKAVETYITKLVSVPSAMKVLLLDTHTVCYEVLIAHQT